MAEGEPCLADAGEPNVCRFAATGHGAAVRTAAEAAMLGRHREAPDAAAGPLRLVAACPEQGGVLPHRLQAEGCGCGELSACRAGKGRAPGRVSLADCLACVAAAGA